MINFTLTYLLKSIFHYSQSNTVLFASLLDNELKNSSKCQIPNKSNINISGTYQSYTQNYQKNKDNKFIINTR
ncbi:hypothetical protein AB204_05875 [Xenorhabdus khoisanae]|uniref:Uncharacterized protein n=1 Tax=Xenorhabdus khoisanae TaxID=880157 RepID=A0A0J5FVA7_9GAMM|nr:hypothetical protein AB204_05875 [Xenorhabdus khoisanae]